MDRLADFTIWALSHRTICGVFGHPPLRRNRRDLRIERAIARRMRSPIAVASGCVCEQGARWVYPE